MLHQYWFLAVQVSFRPKDDFPDTGNQQLKRTWHQEVVFDGQRAFCLDLRLAYPRHCASELLRFWSSGSLMTADACTSIKRTRSKKRPSGLMHLASYIILQDARGAFSISTYIIPSVTASFTMKRSQIITDR